MHLTYTCFIYSWYIYSLLVICHVFLSYILSTMHCYIRTIYFLYIECTSTFYHTNNILTYLLSTRNLLDFCFYIQIILSLYTFTYFSFFFCHSYCSKIKRARNVTCCSSFSKRWCRIYGDVEFWVTFWLLNPFGK